MTRVIMPRYRTKPVNAFLDAVLKKNGYGPGQIKDAARDRKFAYERFLRMVDCVETDPAAVSYVDYAERLGVPIDVFMRGLAGKLTEKECHEWGVSCEQRAAC